MKNFTLLFTSIFLISACSPNEMQSEDSAAPSLVEYVWHKASPEYSTENLRMLVKSWNGMIDSMNCDGVQGANILTPEEENEVMILFG